MEVEAVFPAVCGAFYKAFVLEVDLEGQRARLSFPQNWRSVEWAEMSHIRYPGPDRLGSQSLSPQSKVEAYLPHHDNERPGWWTGVLVKTKGELNVVEFQSGAEKYQDIIEGDKLRPPNPSPPLSKVNLVNRDFSIPDGILDYCQRSGVHENFRAKIKALCVVYHQSSKCLAVIADDPECLERADMLIDMHFRDLNTQQSIMAAQKATSQLSLRELRSSESCCEARFFVDSDLVGLAIGKDGSNVNEVRKFPGVQSVEFDDHSSHFIVKGESEEAVGRARERLEFTKDTLLIPKSLAGKVIGKNGHVITDILTKSKVNNVKVVGDEDAAQRNIDTSTNVAFDFIGRVKSIDNAKMMMEYHVDHLRDLESILATRHEAPSYFPRPARGRGRKAQPQPQHSEGSDSEPNREGKTSPGDDRGPDRRRPRGQGRQRGGRRGRGRRGQPPPPREAEDSVSGEDTPAQEPDTPAQEPDTPAQEPDTPAQEPEP